MTFTSTVYLISAKRNAKKKVGAIKELKKTQNEARQIKKLAFLAQVMGKTLREIEQTGGKIADDTADLADVHKEINKYLKQYKRG